MTLLEQTVWLLDACALFAYAYAGTGRRIIAVYNGGLA